MPINWYMFFVTGLIPIAVGFFYYNKNIAGNIWMNVNGFTEETIKAKNPNMAVTFIASYIFSVMLSFVMTNFVIHQSGVFGMLAPEIMEAGNAAQTTFNELMELYGDKNRNFGHGAAHGLFVAIFIALPLIAINALFEMRGWKYILIHFIYWLICLVLIGGVLCATIKYAPL